MTTKHYFCRASLKQDASIRALAPLLMGKVGRVRSTQQSGHHLVWSLFADDADRSRDFLWREIGPGTFFVLSARPPEDRHGLFDIAEPKLFQPSLVSGDKLGFSLRANPVVRKWNPSKTHKAKHDVVMEKLRNINSGARSERRLTVIRESTIEWLNRQGDNYGFSFNQHLVRVEGYEQHYIVRKGTASALSFSTIDFDGYLTVDDPNSFLPALCSGFGSARAFGCGLMLVRRS